MREPSGLSHKKLTNGKLVHMLVGAKIASDLLKEVGYPTDKAKEIIEKRMATRTKRILVTLGLEQGS